MISRWRLLLLFFLRLALASVSTYNRTWVNVFGAWSRSRGEGRGEYCAILLQSDHRQSSDTMSLRICGKEAFPVYSVDLLLTRGRESVVDTPPPPPSKVEMFLACPPSSRFMGNPCATREEEGCLEFMTRPKKDKAALYLSGRQISLVPRRKSRVDPDWPEKKRSGEEHTHTLVVAVRANCSSLFCPLCRRVGP